MGKIGFIGWGADRVYRVVSPLFVPVECLFFIVVPVFAESSGMPREAATDVLIVTTVVGFATMLTQQLFASWNQGRRHREELESRAQVATLARAQLDSEAEKLRLQTELRAAEVRLLLEQRQNEAQRQLTMHHDALTALIEQNIAATNQSAVAAKEAFHEANQANLKIENLQHQGILLVPAGPES